LPINWVFSKWVFLSKKERNYRRAMKEYKKAMKEYKKATKGMPRVKGMAFALNEDNEEILEKDLKPVKKSGLDSLRQARKNYHDLMMREGRVPNQVQEESSGEVNELLDRPFVEEKKVEEKVEEFVPQEEYKPKEEEPKQEVLNLKKPKKPKKLKKHRFLGMLLGGVLGLFVGAVTLTPVIGVINLANDINSNNVIELENGKTVGLFDRQYV